MEKTKRKLSAKALADKLVRLVPNGIPCKLRIYDNGGVDKENGSIDRYTVIFTGNYAGREGCDYLAMNGAPFHPQGFGQHGWSAEQIDRPRYGHLGKKIKFEDLPEDCKALVLSDYLVMWGMADDGASHARAREILKIK